MQRSRRRSAFWARHRCHSDWAASGCRCCVIVVATSRNRRASSTHCVSGIAGVVAPSRRSSRDLRGNSGVVPARCTRGRRDPRRFRCRNTSNTHATNHAGADEDDERELGPTATPSSSACVRPPFRRRRSESSGAATDRMRSACLTAQELDRRACIGASRYPCGCVKIGRRLRRWARCPEGRWQVARQNRTEPGTVGGSAMSCNTSGSESAADGSGAYAAALNIGDDWLVGAECWRRCERVDRIETTRRRAEGSARMRSGRAQVR